MATLLTRTLLFLATCLIGQAKNCTYTFPKAYTFKDNLPLPEEGLTRKLVNEGLNWDWENPDADPYALEGRDVIYNPDNKSCYATVKNVSGVLYYTLDSVSNMSVLPVLNDTVGIYLTHGGPCGACSTIQDLALYKYFADNPDGSLTTTVKACAFGNLFTAFGRRSAKKCIIEDVGFTPACSTIWAWNSRQTALDCMVPCMTNLMAKPVSPLRGFFSYNPCNPYTICPNTIDGEPACDLASWVGEYRLNECLQCDECFAGPVFKKYSGRTRRNSGLKDMIQRPDSQQTDICYV